MQERETKKKLREKARNDLQQRRVERRVRRRMLSSEAESEPRVTLARRLGWTFRESWWSLQERLLWPLADWSRVGFDAVRWPVEHVAWTARERLLWPIQDRLAERPDGTGRLPKAATVSVVAVLALGSLGAGALVASGGDGDSPAEPSAPVVAQSESEDADASDAPTLVQTAPKPKSPSLAGPRPSFGAKSDAERRKARAALRKLKKAGEETPGPDAEPKQAAAGSQGAVTASTEETSSPEGQGSEATSGTTTDPTTGATASNAESERKARRKESPLSVAERFAMAFVSYEVGASGQPTEASFKDTTDTDLFKSLMDRPPRQPKGGKVPKARVVNLVGGPRKKKSMEISVSLLRVDGISEIRLDMARVGRGWVVKTVRG